jgi:double-strand break repair protein MRE11
MDNDILRILVSTDNHLGYAERDPVRGMDSFSSFEEVLLTAHDKQADFVLLAGDMFHDNKPSRKTMVTATKLLKKHCFGDDPVFIRVTNDTDDPLVPSMNFNDPHASVSLPVFAIHGNHDDPSRESMGEALCAMDQLYASNLVNYFGKVVSFSCTHRSTRYARMQKCKSPLRV